MNIKNLNNTSLDVDLVEQRCVLVLKYLFPEYETEMTAKQYKNAMDALRSIAFGAPKGKYYK